MRQMSLSDYSQMPSYSLWRTLINSEVDMKFTPKLNWLLKAFDFNLKLDIASLHVYLGECNIEFTAPQNLPSTQVREQPSERNTRRCFIIYSWISQIFSGFVLTLNITGTLWLSAESLCLTCTLWCCQQPLLRLIRNSPVPVACVSAIETIHLYIIYPRSLETMKIHRRNWFLISVAGIMVLLIHSVNIYRTSTTRWQCETCCGYTKKWNTVW